MNYPDGVTGIPADDSHEPGTCWDCGEKSCERVYGEPPRCCLCRMDAEGDYIVTICYECTQEQVRANNPEVA